MKRATKQLLSLTAAGLVLATGCAAGPQRLPGAGANAPGQKIASTTGDMDACAMALGNLEPQAGGPTTGALGFRGTAGAATPGDTDRMPPLLRGNAAPQGERAQIPWTTGNRGNALTGGLTGGNNLTGAAMDTPNPAAAVIMANGLLLGNVALVALPEDVTTPPGGVEVPAGGAGAPGRVGVGRLIAPPGAGGDPAGIADRPGNGRVTGGMAGRTVTGAGAQAGAAGTPAGAVGTPAGTKGAPAGALVTPGAPGAAATPPVGPGNSAGSSAVALNRIVASCGRLSEVRTVNGSEDRVRMGEIAGSIRRGTPITEFMQELTDMSARATTAWSAPPGGYGMTPGTPGASGPGAAGAGTP